MTIANMWSRIAAIFAMVAAAGLAACDDVNIQVDGKGVPLAQLDMSGDPPTKITLASPDNVVIASGEGFTIDVEGSAEARDRMRFALDDGALAIHRENGTWDDDDKATITIAIPPPEALVMAGSGTITTDALGDNPEIVIAGSGTLAASGIAADAMQVTIAGSGIITASGEAEDLDLTVAGSGNANMDELQVGNAEVTIAGSGNAAFASDGAVEASIVGSGTVRVAGSASCHVDAVGSGRLICEGRPQQ